MNASLQAMPFVRRRCPVCGSGDESAVFAEANLDPAALDQFAFASRKTPEYMHYRLIACPTCDLLYANPLPAAESLVEAYRDAAFDSGEEARLAARCYARFLRDIKRRLPDLDGALDIGAGDGAFLEELLAAGFINVAGVEPSAAPIAAARPHVRKLIAHAAFQPESFRRGKLSLVTCFQTLEHLPDPMAMCSAAATLLKPGGAAFFIGHNRRAASARLLGRRSPIFDVEHLQLFSKASFAFMIRRAGLVDGEMKPVVNSYPLHYWTKLFPLPGGMKRRMVPWLKALKIGYVRIPLPAGNLACIAYRPTSQ